MKQIPGQMSLSDYKPPPPIIHPVNISGLCDDARCPRCNYWLDDLTERDCKQCPVCGLYIDWAPWYSANKEVKNDA